MLNEIVIRPIVDKLILEGKKERRLSCNINIIYQWRIDKGKQGTKKIRVGSKCTCMKVQAASVQLFIT